MNTRISIIAAMGKNREIGKRDDLIWRVSSDLKRVKTLTMGHPLIMGRKTHESIGRPLPGRTNIIVSRTIHEIPGCVVVPSFEEALETAGRSEGSDEVFIFGGAEIYRAGKHYATRLYLTLFDATDDTADAFFPEYSEFSEVVGREAHTEGDLAYEWVTLDRG